MARFLSAAWLEEVARAAAAGDRAGTIPSDVSLIVRQVVAGGPDGDVVYSIRFGEGTVTVDPGAQGEPDIELRSRYDTAVSISKGEVSPAVALASGALEVRGRVELLAEHRDAWVALEDLLAPVRAMTEY